MSYKFIWESKGLLVEYSGTFSKEEIVSSINEMCGHEKFDNIAYRIVDLTGIDENQVTVDDVKTIVAHDLALSKINSKLKFAVITENESLQGLAALYELESNTIPWEFRQFTTLQKARVWVS